MSNGEMFIPVQDTLSIEFDDGSDVNVVFEEDSDINVSFEQDSEVNINFGEFQPIAEEHAVLYIPQVLTETQQAQVRQNIGVSDEPDKHFSYRQYSASDEWIIQHNLNKQPSVTVVDSAGTVVVGEVIYLDMNTVKITFTAPFSGRAYLN